MTDIGEPRLDSNPEKKKYKGKILDSKAENIKNS